MSNLFGFNEAGAHAPRNTRRRPCTGWTTPGFNEAGAHAPRNTCITHVRYTEDELSFNEAGAHAPRNTRVYLFHGNDGPLCFNEAGAHAPRNTSGWNHGVAVAGLHASMRPGHMRPGILHGTPHWWNTWWRFNEAGAHAPRNTSAFHQQPTQATPASMRPGHMRPGIRKVIEPLMIGLEASMRPGHMRPGIHSWTVASCSTKPSFNEAGAHAPRNTTASPKQRASRSKLQ